MMQSGTTLAKHNTEQPLLVGIDGGGSHCRLRLTTLSGDILAETCSGPANLGLGKQRVQAAIMQALQQALSQAGLTNTAAARLHVVAGLAGAHLPVLRQQASDWQLPFASWSVTTDLHTACLGAHAGADGAVVILGTGFSAIALRQRQQQERLIGGYGFPINATCSGAGLGLEAIKAVLLAMDGVGEPTLLVAMLEQTLGATGYPLAELFLSASPAFYAQLAPLVFAAAAQQDAVAMAILQQGAAFIDQVAEQLQQAGRVPLCLLGGVAVAIVPWLNAETRAMLVTPAASALDGACWLARERANLAQLTKEQCG
ncbi:BadF/BadG/BcrA/BcrD ATPase family protein [Alishewanella longhuensis]